MVLPIYWDTLWKCMTTKELLQEVLATLRGCARELSNSHVIRLIEGYFLEMALVVAELGRIVKPGGTVVMVNDNVQYHGEEVPVDLILSDFAEQCGFSCRQISVLPTREGKLKPTDGALSEDAN